MIIDEIRKEIDLLDDKLLEMFNKRAILALKIGKIKKDSGLPIYDPEREQTIFNRMQKQNLGPLDNSAVIRLFECVVGETRKVEGA